MPFKLLDPNAWVKSLSRTLINGPPNSRKTTSLLTWPKPLFILVYPNEGGAASIPADDPEVTAMVFEEDEVETPGTIIAEIEKVTIQALTGGHGDVKTFAGDGIHKLYRCYFEREFRTLTAAYPGSDEDKLIGRAYGNAHNEFLNYLGKVKRSGVENIVFTVWDGKEKDDDKDTSTRATSHIYPDLPGQLAKRIMGEFSVVLYAILPPGSDHTRVVPKWQIQPTGAVWGAAIKCPIEIAKDLPQEVEQDWAKLLPILKGEVKAPRLVAPRGMPSPAKVQRVIDKQ